MTGRDRSTRRGRILVVGDAPVDEAERPVTRVRDLFAAIGEIATSKASDPVEAVFVDRLHAGPEPDHVAEAIGRIDPAVYVEVICDGERSEESKTGRPERESAGQHAATHVRADGSPHAERSASPHAAVGGLGDIDLVQAVMVGEDVAAIGLRIVREQTGWSDVRMAEGEEGEEVECGGVNHGRLVSAAAGREELQSWATWLAHWLTLARRFEDHRRDALQDDLTGAWNRRFFTAFLGESINRAARRRRPVTVMVFDLDDFKHYNDTYGHAAGDEILIETVRLLSSVIRKGDRVCRIGGDEFAVVFADPEGPRSPGSAHPETVERIAQRFQNEICQLRFPKLGPEAPGNLTISAGLATYPWDGRDAQALLEHADQLALQSKRKGKNVITLGPGAMHVCRNDGG